MKKKEPLSKSTSIRNVVVYREDLEEIIQLLESREMQITISDSGFEYSKFDEVTKHRGYHLHELNISGDLRGNKYGIGNSKIGKDIATAFFHLNIIIHAFSPFL